MKMNTITRTAILSPELGTLWMTYQIKSLMKHILKRFSNQSEDNNAKKILNRYVKENEKPIDEIMKIFNKEKSVLPAAFDEKDVINDAPPLFDDILLADNLFFNKSSHFGHNHLQ